jgi:alginate O-acetyltransferase complex protein AlgI
VLADNLAPWVDQVYASPHAYSGSATLLATYMYACQIFLDFSGYSDIAIGVARVMGIRFRENFNAPYLATSLREFWRRWHISLSTWLRDYLYIPLGGSRGGVLRTVINLLITMALGGLWHGAAWGFLVWGSLHGLWLAVEHLLHVEPATPRFAWPRRLLVFHGVCFTWIFFRAVDLHTAFTVIGRIARWSGGETFVHGFAWAHTLMAVACGCLYFAIWYLAPRFANSRELRFAATAAAVLVLVLFGADSREFIYFVF